MRYKINLLSHIIPQWVYVITQKRYVMQKKLYKMIEAIGWLTVAVVVMIVGKAIAKKLWPEDWEDEI